MNAPALPLPGGREPVAKAAAVDLKVALREKFGAKGYQIFFEVGNDTGARVRRHADAVSIGIWPSTGHAIHGFEIKVSRGDWLRELADPSKSQEIFRFCHRWSLVTPAGLVASDELPPGWGHYAFKDGRLREAVMPKRMEPESPTPGFMAALVRCAGALDNTLIAEMEIRLRREEEEKRAAEVERRLERAVSEKVRARDNAIAKLKELEDALGQPLSTYWDMRELAAGIRLVKQIGLNQLYGGVWGLLNSLDASRKSIDEALTAAGFTRPGEGA